MTAGKRKTIYVYADWEGLHEAKLMGVLFAEFDKNKELFSFEYDENWLESGFSQILDPDLMFFGGPQYVKDKKDNFGVFHDSSPDRWGRLLMRRREAAAAKKEKRRERSLSELDYLLGVFDGHRMGALRFKDNINGPFLDDNEMTPAPPHAKIRDLEYASLQLEKENSNSDPEYMKWLNLLLIPGSSLGGARPKANVADNQNVLWIAKFPSAKDDIDKGLWEMITNSLAKKAGINAAEGLVKKYSANHTFLSKRFDRKEIATRIHFASAMTMLGYKDNSEGVSYLELAEFLIRYGGKTKSDMEELWRRIVFNVCVKNTDDHLRNHGFLLTKSGWILSPAYDMNPNPDGTGLSLNISENDNSLDLDLALSVAGQFRLSIKRANEIIHEVKSAVNTWFVLAKKYKAPKEETDYMRQSFLV